MPVLFDKTEADISIFDKARKKFSKCPNADIFYEIGYCKLFHYTFDKSFDMLHHCGSCKANTSEPTTTRASVRFP